jgi:hypothetical protein
LFTLQSIVRSVLAYNWQNYQTSNLIHLHFIHYLYAIAGISSSGYASCMGCIPLCDSGTKPKPCHVITLALPSHSRRAFRRRTRQHQPPHSLNRPTTITMAAGVSTIAILPLLLPLQVPSGPSQPAQSLGRPEFAVQRRESTANISSPSSVAQPSKSTGPR